MSIIANGSNQLIVKSYGKKNTTFKTLKYALLEFLGRTIPIEYQSAKKRRSFESECLILWNNRNFRAPHPIDPPKGWDQPGIWLCEEHISGQTLKQYLNDNAIKLKDKWNAIDAVFQEMSRRHCIAIYEEEHRLIHYDSNMRNILLSESGPTRIDFEMGHLDERIDRSASREVKKLTLEIINAIGKDQLETLIEHLFSNYGIRHIIRRMADEELNRNFFYFHKKRDQKKKNRHIQLTTKLDLAYCIREKFQPTQNDQQKEHSLEIAESTSWDGKFYQSLDDNDPRGRDMKHRYQVMKFPESLEGQTILDIGCNLGRICIDAAKRDARRSVGIDFREDVMTAINEYCSTNDVNAEFFPFDINQGIDALQNMIGKEKFDVVCALSIWSHVDQKRLWEIINGLCDNVFYFEDNAPSRVKSLSKVESILRENLKFRSVEFLGFTIDRGVRAIFKLSKPAPKNTHNNP